MRVVPGDPARLVGGPDAGPEELATIRAQFGLDKPLLVQFGRYLSDILRGEFGRSLKTQRPVIDEITPRLANTALLAVLSTLFAAGFGLLAGIVAAARRHSAFDHATMVVAMVGVSTPSFYLGIVLIVESISMRDFPVVQGAILLVTLVSVLVNLAADILYGYADPRIKY